MPSSRSLAHAQLRPSAHDAPTRAEDEAPGLARRFPPPASSGSGSKGPATGRLSRARPTGAGTPSSDAGHTNRAAGTDGFDARHHRRLRDDASVAASHAYAGPLVLVHPRTPESLGAAARALKNFGQPTGPGFARRGARTTRGPGLAVGAEDVLGAARLAATMEEAVARLQLGGGDVRTAPPSSVTAGLGDVRRRGRTESRPGAWCSGTSAPGSGGTSSSRCHALTRVPSDARQPSLNLAQAALHRRLRSRRGPPRSPGHAAAGAPSGPPPPRNRARRTSSGPLVSSVPAAPAADPSGRALEEVGFDPD